MFHRHHVALHHVDDCQGQGPGVWKWNFRAKSEIDQGKFSLRSYLNNWKKFNNKKTPKNNMLNDLEKANFNIVQQVFFWYNNLMRFLIGLSF